MRRSTQGSRCSTRPTSTATRRVKRSSVGRCRAVATESSSHRSSASQEARSRRGASPAYVRASLEASLRRLGTDRIDLYQLHEPRDETPIGETLGELDALVREGKVREIGCSNFSATQLRAADRAGEGARFACVQNELNLLDRADIDDGLDEAGRLGIAYLRTTRWRTGC